MEDVNISMSEAAQLDGANVAQEFIYVTIPTIFPTIVTLFTVALAALFTDQFRMFSLYKYNEVGSLENIGHFLYMEASRVGKFRAEDRVPRTTLTARCRRWGFCCLSS